MKSLNEFELASVSGAGEDGFRLGYTVAKALGQNEVVAVAAGVVASAVEDAVDNAVNN